MAAISWIKRKTITHKLSIAMYDKFVVHRVIIAVIVVNMSEVKQFSAALMIHQQMFVPLRHSRCNLDL